MIKILGQLGIDLRLLLAQLINFGLLLWLLKKFLYGPLMRRIEEDEAALKEVERKRQELVRERERQHQELIKARRRAREIIAEAEEIAAKIRQRARVEAEKEKERTVQQIRSRLQEIENAQS